MKEFYDEFDKSYTLRSTYTIMVPSLRLQFNEVGGIVNFQKTDSVLSGIIFDIHFIIDGIFSTDEGDDIYLMTTDDSVLHFKNMGNFKINDTQGTVQILLPNKEMPGLVAMNSLKGVKIKKIKIEGKRYQKFIDVQDRAQDAFDKIIIKLEERHKQIINGNHQ